jgi:hypothetical protein
VKNFTKSDWAYFAGLFDGEGSVTVSQVTRKTATVSCRAGMTLTNMSLRISNNNPVPLLELEKRFGGRVRNHSSARKDSWVWICLGHKSVEFANKILPHTRIKTGQLEIYVAFAALKRRKAEGRKRLTKDELAERRKLIQELDKTRKAEGGKVGLRLITSEPL